MRLRRLWPHFPESLKPCPTLVRNQSPADPLPWRGGPAVHARPPHPLVFERASEAGVPILHSDKSGEAIVEDWTGSDRAMIQ